LAPDIKHVPHFTVIGTSYHAAGRETANLTKFWIFGTSHTRIPLPEGEIWHTTVKL